MTTDNILKAQKPFGYPGLVFPKGQGDDGKRLLFVHIPRTGGSNVWHSAVHTLAQGQAKERVYIIDLYYESLSRYHNLSNTANALRDIDFRSWKHTDNFFLHHHTTFGIWRVLGNDFPYCTLLRDPIERAISHYFHSLRLYYDINEEKTACSMKPNVARRLDRMDRILATQLSETETPAEEDEGIESWHGDDALEMLLPISENHNLMSAEAILAFVDMHRTFANYYTNFFCAYFCGGEEIDPKLIDPKIVDAKAVELLSEVARRHFSKIAFSVDEALDYVEQTFNKKIEKRDVYPNAVARAIIDDVESLKKALLPYFEHDYHLLDLLGFKRAE